MIPNPDFSLQLTIQREDYLLDPDQSNTNALPLVFLCELEVLDRTNGLLTQTLAKPLQ